MNIVAVIPARYKSSRFPGKPLEKIHGYPMIQWVYNQAKQVEEFRDVYVATEDERIVEFCKNNGLDVILTSEKHATGTDRLTEVAEEIDADLFVNIQGDEPIIEPETIKKAIQPFFDNNELQVSNLMTKISDPVELINFTVPKVITNDNNIGIYLSRGATPYPKGSINYSYYKQVCVYGFTPEALEFYKNAPRSKNEIIEDIEILRFIENRYDVQFVEVETRTIAVDTPNDLKKVNDYVTNNQINFPKLK